MLSYIFKVYNPDKSVAVGAIITIKTADSSQTTVASGVTGSDGTYTVSLDPTVQHQAVITFADASSECAIANLETNVDGTIFQVSPNFPLTLPPSPPPQTAQNAPPSSSPPSA